MVDIRKVISNLPDEDTQRPQAAPATLAPGMLALRSFQSRRLRSTYTDLLADAQFAPACEFFLSDIYAPRDFSQRDTDIEHLHNLLKRFLPEPAIRLLTDALEANHLAYKLDQKLLEVMQVQLGMQAEITPAMYAAGYRLCDNYAERSAQIEGLAHVIGELGALARQPLARPVLAVFHSPAQRFGWMELYDFLQRGRAAFHPLKELSKFTNILHERELRLLDQIFSGIEFEL